MIYAGTLTTQSPEDQLAALVTITRNLVADPELFKRLQSAVGHSNADTLIDDDECEWLPEALIYIGADVVESLIVHKFVRINALHPSIEMQFAQ